MEGDMKEDNILEQLDRIMRLLRRTGAHHPHGGRGTGRLLRTIIQNPGISTRELAMELDVRPSSLNEILGRLAEEGIVERKRNSEDLRVYEVYLTENGKQRMREEQIRSDAMMEKINAILNDEERAQFIALSEKLAAGLENIGEEKKPDHKRRDF